MSDTDILNVAELNAFRQIQKLQAQQLTKVVGLMEAYPAWAQDSDEKHWLSLSGAKKQYTEDELKEMQENASAFYYAEPAARGLVETMINFILGPDIAVIPKDEDPQVTVYWDLFRLINDWPTKIREIVRRVFRDGECFIRFFNFPEGVQYYNDIEVTFPVPLIRFVDVSEITDKTNEHTFGIHTDPDDIENVIAYIRTYTDANNVEHREVIPADEMIHIKILVDSNIKRGISFFVGIGKYITKYRQWLDDRIWLNKIRTLFNIIMKVSGNVGNIAKKYEDATVQKAGASIDRKKMPSRGSMLIATPGVDYEFKSLDIHAQDTKDDGRNIELMICKGTNLVEYIVRGDASNANYASTMVSESPMVRGFQAWHGFFKQPLSKLYRKVIRKGIVQNSVPSVTKHTSTSIDPLTGKEHTTQENAPTNVECDVRFTELIHRDPKEEAEASQIHHINKFNSLKGLRNQLGLDNTQVEIEVREEEARAIARGDEAYKREEEADANRPEPPEGAEEDE